MVKIEGEVTGNYRGTFEASNYNWVERSFNNFDYGLDYGLGFAVGVDDFVLQFIDIRQANPIFTNRYFHNKSNFQATYRGERSEYAA